MKKTRSAKLINKSTEFNKYGIEIRKMHLHNEIATLHWHNCWELEFIVDGKGRQTLNGTEYPLTKGTIYILNPTDFHEVISDDTTIFTISFTDEQISEEFLEFFSGNGGGRQKIISGEQYEHFLQIAEMLLYEGENQLKYGDTASLQLLGILLTHTMRIFDGHISPKKEVKKALISKAISYINHHFRENPSLTDTANFLGITPNYLSEEFHSVTGKKYKEYLTDLRLSYAKKLLTSSNISITEICFASGFSSLSNFLRVFKEKYGISPHNMRKNS